MILISGATGRTGRAVIEYLLASGKPVRAIVRDPAKGEALRARGIEVVTGDLRDRALLTRAFVGVERAMLATANAPEQLDIETGFIDAAAAARVTHVVKLSAIGADAHSPAVLKHYHGEAEAHLRRSGLTHTVLQPNFYMDNLLGLSPGIARDGVLALPMGDGRVGAIDVRDVAAALFMALTQPGPENRTSVLTGPELLSFGDMAAVLSEELEREIRYVDQPVAEFRQEMLGFGVPAWNVDAMLDLFALIRQDRNACITGGFAETAGRVPRTLREFVRDHRDRFTPSGAAPAA